MISLRSLGASLSISVLAITIVGCSTDNGGDSVTAPTPAPTTVPTTTTTTIPAGSIPEISHLSANFSNNTCVRAADHLSAMALVVTFDYTDGGGDLSGGRVQVNRVYNTGRSESHVSPVPSEAALSGAPTAGTVTISNACPLYDNATSSTETFTLFDADGRASNSLSITVNRPPGDK
jgi:hypothetical protein